MNRLHYLLVGGLLILTVVTAAAYPSAPDQSDHPIYLPLISRSSIAPEIISFRSEPEMVLPGETVTLSWEIVRADQVELRLLYHFYWPIQWWTDLPMSGAQTYTVPDDVREPVYFEIEAGNSASGQWLSVMAELEIGIICPDEWFFAPAPEEGCPFPQQFFLAAEQPFEHGYMVWLEDEDRVAILYDSPDQQLEWFDNNWNGGPICDLGDPPGGYYHPEGIFGYLWCQEEVVRERLGWGIASDVGYETVYQEVIIRRGLTQFPLYVYVRAADGNVWAFYQLPLGSWEKIIVTE